MAAETSDRLAKAKKAERVEAGRVDDLLARDRRDRRAERKRRVALDEVKRGRYANIAETILPLPPEQDRPGETVAHPVDNVAGTARKLFTRKKKTRLEKLYQRQVITLDQYRACEWYATQHETAYAAGQGTTANYGAEGGGGTKSYDHSARTIAQCQARLDWEWARKFITPGFVKAFDDIVIHGATIGDASGERDAALAFRMQAQVLFNKIGDRL